MGWRDKIQPAKTGSWRDKIDTGGLNKYMDTLSPEQTQPEWLSTGDRLINTNTAQSVPKQVEYLKQQYPDKDFTMNANGQVLAKAKGDAKWQVQDPDTGFFSSDFLKDAGDVAFDTGAGIINSLATAAGAVGGAMTPVPGGALAGASLASAASGAGTEAFRQKLGSMLGIPQEVDGGDVIQAGVVNAVTPLLFGGGSATSGQLAKLAASKGISVEAAKELFDSQSRGVLKRGVDATLPRLGSLASGISVDNIKNYAKNYNQVDDLAQGGQGGITNYVSNLTNKVNSSLKSSQRDLGKKIGEAMKSAGKEADISEAKNVFLRRIEELENKKYVTNDVRDEINALKGLYNKYYGLDKVHLPDESKVLADPELKGLFSQLDNTVNAGKISQPADLATAVDKSTLVKPEVPPLPPLINNSYRRNEILSRTMPDRVAPEAGKFENRVIGEFNKELGFNSDILQSEADDLASAYASKNQQQINSVLKSIEDRRAQVVDDNTLKFMPDKVDAETAFDRQIKMKKAGSFDGNYDVAHKSAQALADDSYFAYNKALEDATGGVSKQAKDDYHKMIDINDELLPKFIDSDKTYQTISNMDKKGKVLFRERLKKAADSGLLDISKEQDIIRAYNAFKDPATEANGTGLMTVLGTLGSLAAYKTGGGYGAAAAGGMGGAAAGKGLSSQRAMEWMTKKAIKANAISNPLSSVINATGPTSIIELLRQQELERQLREQKGAPRY